MEIEVKNPVCDFCCVMVPHWSFKVKDATIRYHESLGKEWDILLPQGHTIRTRENVEYISAGGEWAACDQCRSLIEMKARGHLTGKCTAAIMVKYQKPSTEYMSLHKMVHDNQDAFFNNWDGSPATSITP